MLLNEIHPSTRKVRPLNSVTSNGLNKTGDFSAASTPSLAACAFDDEVSKSWISEEIVGQATGLGPVKVALQTMAQTDSPVLIVGEPGTCKEIIARSLHTLSQYLCFPFVPVNCALAQREDVLGALLGRSAENNSRPFATPGDSPSKAPRTVFLEGVSKLLPDAQEAVLAILQLQHGDGPGFESLLPACIRIIASSDVDLLEATKKGTFSHDLYQHLNVHLIAIPALRDRTEELPMLVQGFLDHDSRRRGQPCRSLSPRAVDLLRLYPWPGNLRELWQVMARFTVLRQAAQESFDGTACLSEDQLDLCRQLHLIPDAADLDEGELIITSLIQTAFLRSP